jgi:hypothetical protein
MHIKTPAVRAVGNEQETEEAAKLFHKWLLLIVGRWPWLVCLREIKFWEKLKALYQY